eukprot:TRINITY_DN2409_c0_g1_i1.p1 TRINITY_DN2409_c0_g1~~TRINITY_DN2409_c0_g1_i1.p1  ORF type:complete len:214 (+),score=30.27 TRINITY_DN2409_c0_g1_i1:56-643(+)
MWLRRSTSATTFASVPHSRPTPTPYHVGRAFGTWQPPTKGVPTSWHHDPMVRILGFVALGSGVVAVANHGSSGEPNAITTWMYELKERNDFGEKVAARGWANSRETDQRATLCAKERVKFDLVDPWEKKEHKGSSSGYREYVDSTRGRFKSSWQAVQDENLGRGFIFYAAHVLPPRNNIVAWNRPEEEKIDLDDF